MKKEKEPGKRQLQTAANRSRIIETSRQLFFDNGYDGTTMTDIIEATGLSNGTIYNLYASKIDILQEIYSGYVDVPLHLNDDYERKVLDPTASIVGFMEDYIGLWMKVGWSVAINVYKAWAELPAAASCESLSSLLRSQRVKTELREFIAHAQAAGTMTRDYSPEEIEDILSTHERGILYLWGLLKGEYDFAGAARKQIPLVISAFLK